MDQLSSMDASFLHFETPETPMHVGSLMLFELPEGYDGDYYEDVKAMLGKRLHLATVLTRKLAPMPFELAEPVWIEDDDIDLDYHVRTVTLRRPGTMAQLEQLIARLHSTLLDRSRPLWEMYVIEGLEGGYIGTVTKTHHAAIDGVSGAELTANLLDLSPETMWLDPAEDTWTPDRIPSEAELVGFAMQSLARQPISAAKAVRRTASLRSRR
jgi:WS/DGAT/MGAT family acyltransferase